MKVLALMEPGEIGLLPGEKAGYSIHQEGVGKHSP